MDTGRLRVELPAIVRNWRRCAAAHGAPAAAVVKADAYGLGAARVAPALAAAGCRHFFVATPAEGEALRDTLGEGPMIAVLDGFAPGAHPRLTPVLNTPERAAAETAPAILHIDTGMNRLGVPHDAAPETRAPLLFVMTHLAVAEEPAHALNAVQARRFAAAAARFPGVARSFANSSGIFLGAGFRSDLARPGAALYGVNPTPGQPNPMEPVVTLDLPVLQLRRVPAGESVGYGAAWVAGRDSLVATVAGGYADGIPRGWRGPGLAEGLAVPLAGRISMDLMMFDVTDCPRPPEWVRVLGAVDAVAESAGTIGYEVLTRLGRRFARGYGGA